MLKLNPISFEQIISNKENLIAFSNIDPETIKKIWINPDEIDITDFENLEYDYNLPLYTKMYFRWKNAGGRSTILFNGCDPQNQLKLVQYFSTSWTNYARELIWFFLWLENTGYSCIVRSSPINGIKFFFELSQNVQEKMINDYNEQMKKFYY